MNEQLDWNRETADCFQKIGYKIFEYDQLSPVARKMIRAQCVGKGDCEPYKHYRTYPLHQITVGQGFFVLYSEYKLGLQACVKRQEKQTGKQYAIIAHDKEKCFEVVRIK